MTNTLTMMMDQLLTAADQEDIPAKQSRCILLLDFSKAYDKVDRWFMYETLHFLGFDKRFVDLIHRIRNYITASFVANGRETPALSVRSGIRRGCALAPLLFLLVVKVLDLALKQDPALMGLQTQRMSGQSHLFSAFFYDSTLYSRRLISFRMLRLVKSFRD